MLLVWGGEGGSRRVVLVYLISEIELMAATFYMLYLATLTRNPFHPFNDVTANFLDKLDWRCGLNRMPCSSATLPLT